MLSYVKRQLEMDYRYIDRNISQNARESFTHGNINELIADVGVLQGKTDPTLLEKTKGVTKYGHGRKAK